MKKTAVLIYDKFCNFEFSVALEMLAMAEKPITIFAKTLNPIRSEEGLVAIAEKTIYELNIDEYDSLLLTGSADLREAAEDDDMLTFIKNFDRSDIIIGAISIAPIFLMKLGMLEGKRFMIGVNKEDLIEEGFTLEDMELMTDWNENKRSPVARSYIKDGNIITAVSSGFVRWAIAFGNELGIKANPEDFGLE